jgi:outer membrane protein assembly factor BamB
VDEVFIVFLNQKWLIFVFCVLIQSCTQIDDFLLGKDNTIKPSALTPLNEKIHFKEQWSTTVSKSAYGHYLKLIPFVSGDILYVAEPRGRLFAIDKYTGKIQWSTPLHQSLVSGPVVLGDTIVVSTNTAEVLALNKQDGSIRWRAAVSSDVLASPLLTKRSVVVKTVDGHLYAFDINTGNKQWRMEHGAPNLILKASSSPVKMGRMVLVGFSDGKLDAIDIDTGRVLWQRSIVYATGASDVERLVDIDADPIVRNEVVYLASYQGYIGAMSLQDGQFIWNKTASTYKNLNIDTGSLYMTDSNDIVWAYALTNGQVRWKQPILSAREVTAPARIGHNLFLGDKTGFLHVIDAEQGTLIGRQYLGSAIEVPPVVSGDWIYVITSTGQLVSFTVGG